jgi:two-component system cell cycle sensor histidine kinase/response regulator CckA
VQQRAGWLFAFGLGCLAAGLSGLADLAGPVLLGSGGALLGIAMLAVAGAGLRARHDVRCRDALFDLVDDDAEATVLVGPEGRVLRQNRAALAALGDLAGGPLDGALCRVCAVPEAIIERVASAAGVRGRATDEVTTPEGRVRLRARTFGDGHVLWRIARQEQARLPSGLDAPAVLVDAEGEIRDATPAFTALAGRRPTRLDDVLGDEPETGSAARVLNGAKGQVRVRLFETLAPQDGRTVVVLPEQDAEDVPDWRVLDTLPVPLLRVAVDGTLLTSNEAARSLLGIGREAKANLADLVTGLGRPVSEWLADAAGRIATQPEVVRAARQDSDVFLQISLARVTERDRPTLVAFLNDATELKTLEAQFVQSQKMQAIGQLAGGVAHDFNNLLTAIRGHCDLLLLKRDAGHPDYADLEQINQNANRAAGLVSQLLAFSRKQALQPQLLDLRDTLSDLAHLLNRLVGERISLEVSHGAAPSLVRADKRQLEQVLMNLVVNARDAMPEGGGIRIETGRQTVATAFRRDRALVPAGEYVVMSVRDDGVGIPADRLPKIFEPFYTTKRTGEGTGLGLSTAYGIVKQSGGFIFADSAPGDGTTFTILLPAHEPPAEGLAAAVPDTASGAGPAYKEGVVLLVEDEAAVRAFASRALRLRGLTVIEAETAEEALEKLSDPDLAVDVFVTDVIMPGMDGPSWVTKALEDRPGTRVVFVSGYAEDSLADSGRRVPGSVFLPKPFSLHDLTATVQAQIH